MYVRYVLDLAEIPTFQSGDRVRAPRLSRGARARSSICGSDGERSSCARWRTASSERPGAGGLPTLRFEAVYAASLRGSRAHLRRPQLREPDRLAGDHGACPRRCAPRLVVRPGREPLGRAARLPARPPSLAARRPLGDGALRRRDGARCASAGSTGVRGAGPHGRRVRGADRARRPVARRRPALAARRGVLGRRARAHARARQGARRRLPRRHARPAAPRVRCSARR